jgi:hypothetical protein
LRRPSSPPNFSDVFDSESVTKEMLAPERVSHRPADDASGIEILDRGQYPGAFSRGKSLQTLLRMGKLGIL